VRNPASPFSIDFAIAKQKLSSMDLPPNPATRRVSQRHRRAVLWLIAGSLALASAGCFHFGAKPVANPPTQQQLQAYADQQTALRTEASLPKDDLQAHCDQLVAATPGVEELRITQGTVESRQWTLLGNGSDHRWVFVRAPDSSSGGWAPKPGLDKLNFQPPLEPALTPGSSHFLAYAPVQTDSLDESQKSDTIREVFGAAQGEFTWRGRTYSYTLTPELPCFPQLE
jgi:hypothetical protein